MSVLSVHGTGGRMGRGTARVLLIVTMVQAVGCTRNVRVPLASEIITPDQLPPVPARIEGYMTADGRIHDEAGKVRPAGEDTLLVSDPSGRRTTGRRRPTDRDQGAPPVEGQCVPRDEIGVLVMKTAEWLEPRGRAVLGYTQASGTRHMASARAHLVGPDSVRFVSRSDPLDTIVLSQSRVSEITVTKTDPASTAIGVLVGLALAGGVVLAVAMASWEGPLSGMEWNPSY